MATNRPDEEREVTEPTEMNEVLLAFRALIEDPGADGLKAKRTEGQPFDTYEGGVKRTAFDGDWKGQKLSEEEYLKAFSAADEQYSRMLTALISAVRKIS